MNEAVERELAEYLGRKREERARGLTFEGLYQTVRHVADGLARHEQTCAKRWEKNDERLKTLETTKVPAERPTNPRPVEDSSSDITNVHDLNAYTEQVKRAAIEGYIAKDSTPEEKVAKLFEAKERDLEFRRLQRVEQGHLEDRQRRSKTIGYVVAGTVIGILGGAGALFLADSIHWISSLHH